MIFTYCLWPQKNLFVTQHELKQNMVSLYEKMSCTYEYILVIKLLFS